MKHNSVSFGGVIPVPRTLGVATNSRASGKLRFCGSFISICALVKAHRKLSLLGVPRRDRGTFLETEASVPGSAFRLNGTTFGGRLRCNTPA